ncbi:MAG: YXWGXW repeat-containing protein [Myxococcota bacterium]
MAIDRINRLGLLWLAVAGFGCRPELPLPASAEHEPSDPVVRDVPYPPPAAKGEEVPPSPDPEAVWIDGYWHWNGRRYVWRTGSWARVPEGYGYAGATAVRLRDGTLMWYPPTYKPLDDGVSAQ